jgi:PHD/YefM family antitoxin component YafN of YafNO toxin-antitoxin module
MINIMINKVIIMMQIRPITDLRNTNEISELCHKNNEPIYITKNGYGDLVVMSIETYEKQFAMLEVYKKLSEAEQELSQGAALLDGDKVFKRLRDKYGRE